jgi:hypothetical protein
MQSNRFWLGLFLSASMMVAPSLQASPAPNDAARIVTILPGTWSGTFISQHENVDPFTITVVIDKDAKGNLVGTAELSSNCIKGTKLQVAVNGTDISLAGSDEDGGNITFHGTIDGSGSVLDLRYIVNGSSSGRCESDNGTGNMGKR